MNMWHRRPCSGTVCSEMSGNGRTRVTVPSDTGLGLSQMRMESVHCMGFLSRGGGTEVVLGQSPSTAIRVSISYLLQSHPIMYSICFRLVWKGMSSPFSKMDLKSTFGSQLSSLTKQTEHIPQKRTSRGRSSGWKWTHIHPLSSVILLWAKPFWTK